MAFATQGPDRAAVAEINITPLVDVMLVLLVIFMVATPLLTRRIDLDLPQHGPPPPPVDATVDLRIDAAGQLYWNGNPTPASALQPMLAAELARAGTQPPLLRVDASGQADYGAVARVLAAARNADWDRIAFVQE